jgi:formyl-CoA transferase
VTKTHKAAELSAVLTDAGVPSGPANRIDEVFADPQVKHLGIATDIDTLPFGPTQLVGQPFAMTRTPTRMAAHPPDRGEHTDEILADIGLSVDEIAGLRSRQII